MDQLSGAGYGYADDRGPRRRRMFIIGLVVLALALAGAWWAYSANSAASGAADGGGPASAAPNVTVIVPGRQDVAKVISANGTIAARREMPVGIAGEGGQIVRDWLNRASGSRRARYSP